MTLIKHKKGGVYAMPMRIFFPKGEAVDVANEEDTKRILRNTDFVEVREEKIKGGKDK
jgi:hypothetical protein